MPRKLIALLISSTLAFSGVSTSGWSATGVRQAPTDGATILEVKNVPPLAPAGAAGIRVAQGSGGNELYIIGGFIAVFALLWLIDSGNDGDDVPSGTN